MAAKELTEADVKRMIGAAVASMQKRLDKAEREIKKLRSDHNATKNAVSRINRKY